MFKRILLGLLLATLVAIPVAEARRNERQVVMAETEVATGTPVTATIANVDHTTGYLIVKTANETATASLVVTVTIESALGDVLICTSTAITTDTTTNILIGSLAAGGQEGVTDACDYPAGLGLNFIFTTSGAGADFDVTAEMQWVN
jgi:hypothetical protein